MNRRTIRVSDDQGHTQDNWRAMEGPALNPEDLSGFHVVEGATGEPMGRPRLPEDQLGESAKRMRRFREHGPRLLTPFSGKTSTPKDWQRERIEREEALARVAAQKARHKVQV